MSALQLAPMLRRLARNHATTLLLACEVAFGLAISIHSAAIPLNLLDRARPDAALRPESLFVVTAWGASAEGLRALMGVEGVSQVERPLQTRTQIPVTVAVPGTPRVLVAWSLGADPTFADVVGKPLRFGRPPSGAGEVALTESLAEGLFGRADVVGETVAAPELQRVVGVLPDVVLSSNWSVAPRHGLWRGLSEGARRTHFMVRASSPTFETDVQAALAAAAPVTVERMTQRIAKNNANASGTLYVIAFMVALLLAVTALGAAAMVGFLVAGRTNEIALRRALGARQSEVVLYFVTETGCVVTLGLALGVSLTALLARVAGWPGLGLTAIAVATFAFVSLVAAWLPARRAAHVPPAVAGRAP